VAPAPAEGVVWETAGAVEHATPKTNNSAASRLIAIGTYSGGPGYDHPAPIRRQIALDRASCVRRLVSNEQLLLTLGAATALLALWAAIFATRADAAARSARADAKQRWDDSIRPLPHFTFTSAPAPGQAIELDVENLGGALAGGGVIVQHGDDLFAGELTLPEKAPARRIVLAPVMKAWQKANQPRTLLLAGRDVSGRTWDFIDGTKTIKDPRKWLAGQLRELRLQGVVDFPSLTGAK